MRLFSLLVVLVLSSGCATITRGTSEAFAIESNPAGADARLSNGLFCKTPCSLQVKRRGDFTVEISKEGYETVRASVTSSVDGAGSAGMAGNVLIGGLIGAGVDAGTGAMHSHKPNPLTVTLTKNSDSSSEIVRASSGRTKTIDPLDIHIGNAPDDSQTMIAVRPQSICDYPERVSKFPDGKTASRDEMATHKSDVNSYVENIDSFMSCIDSEKEQALSSRNFTDVAARAKLAAQYDEKYNLAIEERAAVSAESNKQIRAFNSRLKN